MMACSMCFCHEFNDGINANFDREFTLKSSRGQRYVGFADLVHEIIDGPSYFVKNLALYEFSKRIVRFTNGVCGVVNPKICECKDNIEPPYECF